MITQVEAAVPCVALCVLRADSSVHNYHNCSEIMIIFNTANVRNLTFVNGLKVRGFWAGEL